ncbi:MAG TPA: ABC transporter substrate-binding protein [Flavisolibacter sp.]|nr:ABC transporter substrate-binding protein [Flavisolibacter sp.]
MKKNYLVFTLLIVCCLHVKGQLPEKHKIAVFTPLYLDTVFDAAGNFKPDKSFPKYLNAGVDFYQGVQMAIDSLQKRTAPLEFFIYDTKSKESLFKQLNSIELKDVEMFIAQSNPYETKIIAEAAQRKKIPFISATLPNDAGILNNPFFVVLNATLQTHVEGIYRFIQRYYSLENVVVFRKNGVQEDQIKNYFTDFAKTTASVPLSIKYVDLPADFSAKTIASHLDSTRKTVCIAGTLDENFGIKLAEGLALIKKSYPITVFGMPTWENINLIKPELNDLEVIYTTPFYYNHVVPLENQILSEYTKEMNGRPTDMFFRGYESTLRFALLLLDTKKDIASSLSRKGNFVFTQFDIQPVFKDKKNMNLDYFENKHLYFIKVFGGIKNILY